jgi:opacity protein-like surface antigen
MKRNYLTVAAALVVMGTAHAQQMPPLGGLYGELGYTFLKIDAIGTSGRPGAIRGIIGYEFHPMLSVEGMLGGGVMDDDKNVTVRGITTNATFELKSMYGIWVRPKYVSNQFELFARLGWAHTKVEAATNNAAIAGETQSDNDFAWGIGANYRWNRNFYTGIDWMRYSNQSDHRIDGLTISVGYHW